MEFDKREKKRSPGFFVARLAADIAPIFDHRKIGARRLQIKRQLAEQHL